MPDQLASEVLALLESRDAPARDAAWERFVSIHTRLLLHVARSVVHDPDLTMDAYAWLLEHLREDDSRRLRGFSPAGKAKFTTWLVVVARRLCVDFLRHQGGRTREPVAGRDPSRNGQEFRRRLLHLAGESIELDTLRDPATGPDADLSQAEMRGALQSALQDLPPADQLLLTLRFHDNLQAAEIARVLRLPSQFHVYRRLDRVLGQLRQGLGRKGIDGNS